MTTMNEKERQLHIQLFQMMGQIGVLQQQVARLELEKLMAPTPVSNAEFDAAVDRRDMPSGAPAPTT